MASEAPEIAPSAAMIAAFDQIDELARDLYHRADPTGRWPAADYPVQEHFRREAQRKLQQERYKTLAENV